MRAMRRTWRTERWRGSALQGLVHSPMVGRSTREHQQPWALPGAGRNKTGPALRAAQADALEATVLRRCFVPVMGHPSRAGPPRLRR